MASKCNRLMPLRFKGLNKLHASCRFLSSYGLRVLCTWKLKSAIFDEDVGEQFNFSIFSSTRPPTAVWWADCCLWTAAAFHCRNTSNISRHPSCWIHDVLLSVFSGRRPTAIAGTLWSDRSYYIETCKTNMCVNLMTSQWARRQGWCDCPFYQRTTCSSRAVPIDLFEFRLFEYSGTAVSQLVGVVLVRLDTMGDFTFWISLSMSLSLSQKLGQSETWAQKSEVDYFLFGLSPNIGLSERLGERLS